MNTDFWIQFWPQFFASIASTLFLAILTFVFTYITRFRIAKFFQNFIQTAKSVAHNDETSNGGITEKKEA